MSKLVPIPIPVDGALDTSNPESNVPAGTLVQATDTGHRALGPRPGRSRATTVQAVTGVGRSVYEFDGTDDYVLFPYNAEQMTLGLEWTLDLLFEPTVVGADSGTVFLMGNSTHQDIWVYLNGSGTGADARKVLTVVKASNGSGGSGSASTATDSTQQTLSTVGTPALDPTLFVHHRVVRSTALLATYTNGVLNNGGASLSSTVGHAYAGDGIYLGSKYTDAGDYFGGWIYKVVLRQGIFTDLQDGWMDVAATKAANVLFAAIGGPAQLWVGSTSPAQELSRFRNYGQVTGSPSSDTLTSYPAMFPVQAAVNYTDRTGRNWNLVEVNGRLFHNRAT